MLHRTKLGGPLRHLLRLVASPAKKAPPIGRGLSLLGLTGLTKMALILRNLREGKISMTGGGDMRGYFKRDEKGFTLIELLIVVAIIGILASIAIINLIPAERRAKYARTAGDTKTIVTQALVYMNDNNCAPAGVTDLWDTNGPTGGGLCAAGPVDGYMSQVTDPFRSGGNYSAGFSVTGVNRAWGFGFDGQDDTSGWNGVTPIQDDDLGNSSQLGCVNGGAAVVPSGIC